MSERIHDEIVKGYAVYSETYWKGVRERAAAYRVECLKRLEEINRDDAIAKAHWASGYFKGPR